MNSESIIDIKYSKYIMLIPLLFVFMPRPNIEGIQFLTYPAMGFVIVLFVLNMTKDIQINKTVFLLSVFLFLSTLIMLLSMLINDTLDIGSIAKPILFAIVLYFGYFVTKNTNLETIKFSLKKAAYIIIFIQLVVGLTQLFGISIFAPLYSMEKTRALGTIVRIAGTLANPNIFSWILVQMGVILWLFEKKLIKKMIWVAVALCLVFLSGSRSLLLIFPLAILFVEIVPKKKTPSFFIIKAPFYGVVLYSLFKFVIWFLTKFGDKFPYMKQLLSIFETKDLNSVNSFSYREFMWKDALNQLNSTTTWLFGTGGKIDTVDNDFIYSLANFGISYLVFNLFMYLLIVILFLKIKNRHFKALGLQYILFSLVIGYQADTLSGWNYPIFIMFYTGIATSILVNKNVPEAVEKPVKKIRKKGIKIGNKRLVW